MSDWRLEEGGSPVIIELPGRPSITGWITHFISKTAAIMSDGSDRGTTTSHTHGKFYASAHFAKGIGDREFCLKFRPCTWADAVIQTDRCRVVSLEEEGTEQHTDAMAVLIEFKGENPRVIFSQETVNQLVTFAPEAAPLQLCEPQERKRKAKKPKGLRTRAKLVLEAKRRKQHGGDGI